MVWLDVANHNKATQISDLNDKLSTQKVQTEKAVKTANDNAAAVRTLQERLDTTEDVLATKGTNDAKLAAKIAGLQSEVKHAKASTCVSPSILAVVAGVRNMQTGSSADGTRSGNSNTDPRKPDANAAPTIGTNDPNQAAALIATWIADIYQDDTVCRNNLSGVDALRPK